MKNLAILFSLFILFFSSCQKTTTNLTVGQLTALRLEKDLAVAPDATSDAFTVMVLNQSNGSVIIPFGATSLRITSDGFIILGGTKILNLEQLKSYQVSAGNLTLYY